MPMPISIVSILDSSSSSHSRQDHSADQTGEESDAKGSGHAHLREAAGDRRVRERQGDTEQPDPHQAGESAQR